jgi:hypothetical protein
MQIRELFSADVTRDIPPVVYFHEQSPTKLQSEVSEYIITGGYPEGHPAAKRYGTTGGSGGIHEQFIRLLQGITHELRRKGGPELPASWISGFYGSGKSSFAKLVGLALDGVVLPDGNPLEKALLARDDSPQRQDLIAAWQELRSRLKPIAVVFDIGGVARDNEHIHAAVLRQVQIRLGYCSKSNLVAEHELKLQKDGDWVRFQQVAREVLKKDWEQAKDEEQADDHFSHVLHVMNPDRYRDPTSWIDSRAGSRTGAGSSVREVVDSIDAMLAIKAEGQTLFIVVDEVSQYVHQDEARMLKLQSLVSELGQKLKGAVWLFATGQQQLDDKAQQGNIGKLKDRFPQNLRVHLGHTNIRDVVHKRLLRKRPEVVGQLRELFQKHRGDLKLYGYGCEAITEEDFVEVYPMLPGHIELLMLITSNLRSRSTRTQGDDHAIRGLLQLLGELFREQKLADRPLGDLVTLDAIFEVQHTALDADIQATLARIFSHPEVRDDALAQRVAKAVALLEHVQEAMPTTPDLVASCLYSRLGEGNRVQAITEALEKFRGLNLLSYSEKTGFRIQSSAGQEWERERLDYPVTIEAISEIVQSTIKTLVGSMQERPKHKGRSFPWALWFSDGRQAHDVKLMDAREDSTVSVDFRYVKDGREAAVWVQKSAQDQLNNRIVWVVGEGAIDSATRDLARSRKMVEKYRPRWASLPKTKQQLLLEEDARVEDLEKAVQKAVAAAFHEGSIYFRGQQFRPRDMGAVFTSSLVAIAARALPELYPHTTDLIAVTDSEILQLLENELAGPSTKFLEGALGILSLDDQKYVATCKGEHPKRVATEIQKTGGVSGQTLIATFIGPPYGYPSDLVRACCAGLLRAKLVRIRNEAGDEITSYRDAGVRELFTKDRAFRKAEFFPPAEDPVTPRDRIAIGKFFDAAFDAQLDREDEAFADAAFRYFPHQREVLRDIEKQFYELPGRPALPERLAKLGGALVDCCRNRPIQKIVLELKRHLDALRDGMEQLQVLKTEMTEQAIAAVRDTASVRDYQLAQLVEAAGLAGLEADAQIIREHFNSETPWRAIHAADEACTRIRERYIELRKATLDQQSAEAEQAQARIRLIPGFEQLSPDQAHRVLKPILDAQSETTPEAVSPTLVVLRDTFASRLGHAEELARDRLDDERNQSTEQKVVKVEANIRGREVQSREQLKAIFRELEERIGPLLDQGDRVRIW